MQTQIKLFLKGAVWTRSAPFVIHPALLDSSPGSQMDVQILA